MFDKRVVMLFREYLPGAYLKVSIEDGALECWTSEFGRLVARVFPSEADGGLLYKGVSHVVGELSGGLGALTSWVLGIRHRLLDEQNDLEVALGDGEFVPPSVDSVLDLTYPSFGCPKGIERAGRLMLCGYRVGVGILDWLCDRRIEAVEGSSRVRMYSTEVESDVALGIVGVVGSGGNLERSEMARWRDCDLVILHGTGWDVRGLKELAVEYGCDILVGVQMKLVEEPIGFAWRVGRSADVLLVYGGDGEPLEILKSREGITGRVWGPVPGLLIECKQEEVKS